MLTGLLQSAPGQHPANTGTSEPCRPPGNARYPTRYQARLATRTGSVAQQVALQQAPLQQAPLVNALAASQSGPDGDYSPSLSLSPSQTSSPNKHPTSLARRHLAVFPRAVTIRQRLQTRRLLLHPMTSTPPPLRQSLLPRQIRLPLTKFMTPVCRLLASESNR